MAKQASGRPGGAPGTFTGGKAGSFTIGAAVGLLGPAALHQGTRDPDGRTAWLALFGDEPAGFWDRIPALSRIHHDHLAKVIDFGSSDSHPYVAVEPPDGVTLRQKMAAGPLGGDSEVAAQIGAALCRALFALHSASLLAWDLDPDHVYLGRADADGVELRYLTLAQGGADARFRSPEEQSGEPRTVAGDLYVVGLLLYRLVSGKHAHEDLAPGATPRRLRVVVPEISKGLDAVVMRCLAPRADERYETAAELMDALLKPPERKSISWNVKAIDPGPSLGASEPPRWTKPGPAVPEGSDRLGLMGRILVAMVGAVLAAALVLWLFRRS
jgi:hypothetical protein